MINDIKSIELPKDDSRCASILRTVIRNLKENESRSASSSGQRYGNQVYALRQKMFGNYLPKSNSSQSRTASIVAEPISSRNKIFELRRVMFGGAEK